MAKKTVAKVRKEAKPEYWAKQIREAWQISVQAIIETGQLLIDAKKVVPRGEWGKLYEASGFSERTAQMLIAIAECPHLTNPNHGSGLPPSWRTLYELTKLSAKEFKRAMEEGVITSEMERAEIDGFRNRLWTEEVRRENAARREAEQEARQEEQQEETAGAQRDGNFDNEYVKASAKAKSASFSEKLDETWAGMMPPPKHDLDKVRKIHKLANPKGRTEEEAAKYRAKAAELALEYVLSVKV